MNKINVIILLLTTAYSALFYDQHAGLNFLVFTLALTGCFISLKPAILKDRKVLAVMCLYLLSAICVLIYNSALAILANIISWLLLSAYNFNNRSSVLFNLFFSIYSVLSAPVFMIINLVKTGQKSDEDRIKKSKLRLLTYIVPLIFALVFFFLYKSANPLFEKYTEDLNLDFISVSWLLFTLGGFFIVYGSVKHQRINVIDDWENNIPTATPLSEEKASRWDEKKAAIILFILLNLMLVFINLLDLNYLYLGAGMPKGVTHKQFVHNGVGMLILSVTLAIILILYFFRGKLNFDKQNNTIKWLVYAWVLQNLIMVVSTSIRNHMYVSDALLTYKRIGVYYWLLMAVFGLVTTFWKIQNSRSGWYLFKTNAIIAYVLLVLSACVDWDKLIGNYNLSHSSLLASLDKKYLLAISEVNLPKLYEVKDQDGFNVDSVYHYRYGYNSESNRQRLDKKLYNYLWDMKNDDWRSFSYRKERILNELYALNKQGKINSLDFSGSYIQTLKPVSFLDNIKELNVSQCDISALSELTDFKKLRILNLDGNGIPSLDSLPYFKELVQLSTNNNSVGEFKFIERYKSLEALQLNNNNLQDINGFPVSSTLKELALGGNPVIDLRPLSSFPKLEYLSLNNLPVPIEQFPAMNALRVLELKNSQTVDRTLNGLGSLPLLESLDLSTNNLRNLNPLLQSGIEHAGLNVKFPKLKELVIFNNHLDHIDHIAGFPELNILDLSNNNIRSGDELAELKHLSRLFISKNLLGNINFLNGLPGLTHLNISNNTLLLDFTALKKLEKLEELDVSGTRFDDLSLIGSGNLRMADLGGCRLKSLIGLEKQTNLEILSISYLKQGDLHSIKQLSKLKELNISKTDYKIVYQFKKELPKVKITAF